MKKDRKMIIQAGLADNQISVKPVDGTRSATRDILKEAEENQILTIVLGKKGYSDIEAYSMGSTTRKVLDRASDMAVCIVP